MPQSYKKRALRTVSIALRLVVAVVSLCLAGASAAAESTYTGVLIPNAPGIPIPVAVEFEEIGGRLLGKVKTSAPQKGEGHFLTAEKYADQCALKAYLGEGVTLGMAGKCTLIDYIGTYELFYPDRQQVVEGTFALKRLKNDKAKKAVPEHERWSLASSSNTVCLKSNSQCLAACPRTGDYNAQFLCANNCRHKLNTCKAKRKKLLEPPASKEE
jgi:hypothetical protein